MSVEVKKSQHKYIIGPKGQNLSEILAESGVSVEVPALDSPLETITLRGDTEKLGIALTNVYAKVFLFIALLLTLMLITSSVPRISRNEVKVSGYVM